MESDRGKPPSTAGAGGGPEPPPSMSCTWDKDGIKADAFALALVAYTRRFVGAARLVGAIITSPSVSPGNASPGGA